MDTDRLNDLAELMNEDLSDDERKALSEKLASHDETAVLMGILDHPTLSRANNAPLPFEIGASFFGGWCQDYIRSVAVKDLSYGRKSVNFLAHLGRILGVNPIHCFRKRLELNYPVSKDLGSLQIVPELDGKGYSLHVSHQGLGENGSIEIWENGNLIRKSRCAAIAEHPIQRRKSGTAVSIRHSESPMGVEILLSEIEFSQEDWKRACLAACIEGQFGEALRILRSGEIGLSSGQGRLERVASHLSSLMALTRSEGMALAPIPVSRSVAIPMERKLETYRPVWEGILSTWPEAGSVPNPWNDETWEGRIESETDSGFEPEAKDLIKACLKAVKDPVSIEGKMSCPDPDSMIGNGWMALIGRTHLLNGHAQKAYESFIAAKPLGNDPFGLFTGAALAKHLALFKDERARVEEIEVSSDEVLRETFSSIL